MSAGKHSALTELRKKCSDSQPQLFTFYDKGVLSSEQKAELLSDLKKIDFEWLAQVYRETVQDAPSEKPDEKVTPFEEVTEAAAASEEELKQWRDAGLSLIAEGGVAAVLLAGGQGTRLGSSEPKGCYDIELPSHKSIFQFEMERVVSVKRLAAIHAGKDPAEVSLPVYIMTSVHTHDATRAFFEEHKHFGLPAADIKFFQQGLMPALTPEGKIIMQTPSRVAFSPNGNGGIYPALRDSGSLGDMKRRGVKIVHCFGVDNILVKIGDPEFLGFVHTRQAKCANKVVLKTDPTERVGVMCRRGGKPSVIEYSEISEEMANQRNERGRLVYSAANIAQHAFSLEFLASIPPLPFHVARKHIPAVCADTGKTVKPDSPNGVKLEMFIFDSFPLVTDMLAYAVRRDEEFTAVKNKVGKDSPASARRDVSQLHTRFATAAGATVGECGEGDVVELSPLVSYHGEGLQALAGRTLQPPCYIDTL